jgi:hypothetical protein
MSYKNLAAAVAFTGAVGLGASYLTSAEPASCKLNGDGEVVLTMTDGEKKNVGHNGGWRVNGEATHCIASNGSAPPFIIPYTP